MLNRVCPAADLCWDAWNGASSTASGCRCFRLATYFCDRACTLTSTCPMSSRARRTWSSFAVMCCFVQVTMLFGESYIAARKTTSMRPSGSRLMGDFAPDALKSWTVDRLPARCRLWVELYANHVFLGNAPGSKLYLLLQDRTPHSGTPASRPLWQYLVPLTVPSPAVRARRDDSLATQFARFRMLVASTLIRLRFHVVEGLRFLWESRRWRRHLERIAS